MILMSPIWLTLVVPIALALWRWRLPGRFLIILRAVAMLLLVLAISQPAVELPGKSGTVIVVADRSLSMPEDARNHQFETIRIIQSKMKSTDSLGVVSFGETAVIEQQPRQGAFGGFVNRIGRDASNLSDALQTALALIPEETPGRVLLLTDGRYTGPSPFRHAALAADKAVALDYRLMERPAAADLAVDSIDAPTTVSPGESFMITSWLRSGVGKNISFELLRNGVKLSAGSRTVPAGLSRLVFRDQATAPGTYSYQLRITSDGADSVPENNTARLFVGIKGARPLLCVSGNPKSHLSKLLAAGDVQVQAVTDEKLHWSLDELSGYSAVLLENLPANRIGRAGMENLAAWVTDGAGGLMMTGGKTSYGPGGYFRSPLEAILPVSMELRKEHRKLSIAIVVALDRSGSMAASVGGGKTKMDLANLAAVQVYDLLSEMDEFGCVAVDSSSHIIANVEPVDKSSSVRNRLLRIDSMGGGIFVYEALHTAAAMLSRATAGTKHIILFADAADSEQPGKYRDLLAKCEQAGITCSVIGLGTPRDCDANLLRDVARQGRGRCFFTDKPQELPSLFAQDTFVVARNSFLDEVTPFKITGAMTSLSGTGVGNPPPLGGYNLCYLRPTANLAAVTLDEYKAPVVAAWRSGLGRVLCYSGEADGKYTGPIAKWNRVGEFFSSQARWVAGKEQSLPESMLVTQDTQRGRCRIRLLLDPQRKATPFTAPPHVRLLRGGVGEPPASQDMPMEWVSADELQLSVPIHGRETILATVEAPGAGMVTLSPVCLPYSAEYRPGNEFEGSTVLDKLAQSTGGRARVNIAQIWNDLPRKEQITPVGKWLLLAAAVVFLLEIFERRTGLLTTLKFWRLLGRMEVTRRVVNTERKIKVLKPKRAGKAKEQPAVEEPETSTAAPAKPKDEKTKAPLRKTDMLDAIKHARHRAKGRTGE